MMTRQFQVGGAIAVDGRARQQWWRCVMMWVKARMVSCTNRC